MKSSGGGFSIGQIYCFFCFFDYPINLFIEFTASMQQVVV